MQTTRVAGTQPAREFHDRWPDGLVYFDGEYHLYYQYCAQGAQWGNFSWGHAVSPDLVTWQELPVSIPATDRVMAFSDSIVVDHANTGGSAGADPNTPARVASFTSFDATTKIQSQHLAYSLDRGCSYTPFAGNPISDIGSTEFRDPKVFWHADTQRWVMLAVAALQQERWIYTSSDLRAWSKVSIVGPAGSAANNILLWLGWMSNWDYALALPTQPWRGHQSIVRELDLVDTPHGLRLRQQVAAEVRALIDAQSPLLCCWGHQPQRWRRTR